MTETRKTLTSITTGGSRPKSEQMLVLHAFCSAAISEGRLTVLNGISDYLRQDYLDQTLPMPERAIANISISPDKWRSYMRVACTSVVSEVINVFGRNLITVYPWRGALAFVPVCHQLGLENHCHLGMARDEDHPNITKEVWMDLDPACFEKMFPGVRVLVVDPMNATGGSNKTIILKLLKAGVYENEIILGNVVTAPEGVHALLNEFPQIRIVTAALDSCLNKIGFIVPGLGDAGDKFLDRLKVSYFNGCRQAFSDEQWEILKERIAMANADAVYAA